MTNTAKIRNLASQFKTDAEIAEILSIKRIEVSYLRRKHKIPSGRERLNEQNKARVIEGHKAGMSDRQIAKEYQMSEATVRYVRGQLKLPAARGRINIAEDQLRNCVEKFMTDAEIAALVGASQTGIKTMRERLNIPAGLTLQHEHRMATAKKMAADGKTATEVSEVVGVSVSQVWRMAQSGGFRFARDTKGPKPIVPKQARVEVQKPICEQHAKIADRVRKAFQFDQCPIDEAMFARLMVRVDFERAAQ